VVTQSDSVGLGEPGVLAGIASILGAALSWAAGSVYTKRRQIAADPVVATGWQVAVGAVSAWSGLLLFEGPSLGAPVLPVTAWGWGGLVYNSVIGTALSYFVWFGAHLRLPTAVAAIGTLLVPVIGVLSAMALLGDRPTPFDIFGFALIIAAVILNLRAGA